MQTTDVPAIRAMILRFGGYDRFADRFGIDRRTARRIFAGQSRCPPGLIAEAMAELDRGNGA